MQVRVRGEAAAAAKRELEAGRAALARGRDELLQSQRDLAQAQVRRRSHALAICAFPQTLVLRAQAAHKDCRALRL